MRERGGRVVFRHVKDTKQETVIRQVVSTVKNGSVLATNEYQVYNRLGDLYHHMSTKHLGLYVDEFSGRFNLSKQLTNGHRCNIVMRHSACGKLAWKDFV